MKPSPDPHYRHRFPAEIISHAVWLYHVFSLSLRDVELLLAERGVVVSYESIRRWCAKFAASFANSFTISGVRWTRTASSSTFLSKAVEMRGPRSGSSSDCSGACSMFHV